MRICVFHIAFLTLLDLYLSPMAAADASPFPADSLHFCVPFDYEQWRRENPRPAGKRLADLDVGEPRTVRMIYFLPNDRPYRADVVDSMKTAIRKIQVFYAKQMQAHGYGEKTFSFETDKQGKPLVHRVDGKNPDSHYRDETLDTVLDEIDPAFDLQKNIYLIVIDNRTDQIFDISEGISGLGRANRLGKSGGFALVTGGFSFNTVAHELGHTFGLEHDFHDGAYLMSYGLGQNLLSGCSAKFLAVHPYFNPDSPIEEGLPSTIELLSPLEYPAGSESVSVQLKLSDSEGLHQVFLFRSQGGYIEVWGCYKLAGEKDVVVEFDYDGYSAYDASFNGYRRSLSDPLVHPIRVLAVDTDGNVAQASFVLKVDPSEAPLVPTIVKISGLDQQGPSGQKLAYPFVVEVRDQDDFFIPDAQVTFSVIAGEGRLSGRYSVEETTTDANGRTQSILTLGPNPGSNIVKVSSPGLQGCEPVFFNGIGVGSPASSTLTMDSDYRTWHVPPNATLRLGKGSLGGRTLISGHTGSGRGGDSDRAFAFSPDGQGLVVASSIGVWVYEVGTAREIALLPTAGPVVTVLFSPDGTMLALGFGDLELGTVELWDASTLTHIATLEGHPEAVTSVSFSPDGTTLASGSRDGTVKLWEVATRANFATWEAAERSEYVETISVSFSPDGTMLASGTWDNTVKLWDVATGEKIATLEGHRAEVKSVSFSPNGTTLASGSRDGTVKLWEVATRANFATLEGHTSQVNSVSFSPNGNTLASGSSDYTVRLWETRTGTNFATFEGHSWVESVLFSPDGNTLASGSSDGTLKLWDIKTRNAAAIYGHNVGNSISFSPDGNTLASGSTDETIGLWDIETGRKIKSLGFHQWGVDVVVFSSDGILASGSLNNSVMLWDVATGRNISPRFEGTCSLCPEDRYFLSRGMGQILSLSFSPDGTTLAAGDPEGIVLWDVATGTHIATPFGHTSRVRSLAFSPDGAILASAEDSGTGAELWDASTLTHISTLGDNPVNSVSFSPDGTTLASGVPPWYGGRTELWDLGTRNKIITHYGCGGHVAFSPDGTILACMSDDNMVMLWDLTAPQDLITTLLEGHTGRVHSMSFSPDGRILASAGENGAILLWNLQLLQPRPHTLIKVAGDKQQSPAGEALAKPFVVWVRDQHGDLFAGAAVTFTATAGDGTLSATTATTDANGRAESTLTLGRQPGGNTVEVTVADLDPVVFSAVGQAIPQTLAKVSGDEQEGPAGGELAEPFVVSVLDQNGDPLAGTTVTFAVTAGGGTLSATADTTGENGLAATTLTLGSDPGGNTVEVTVAGLNPKTYIALGVAIPRTLSRVSGDQQQGTPGTTLSAPLVVSVLDQNGRALAGAAVTFAVTAGEGTLSATTATTDANGRASSTLTLGSDPGGHTVEATVAELDPVTFTATAEASPDFDGDGETGFSDFFLFADAFGGSDPRFDLDGSGSVDFADFFLLADHFEDPARGKLLALAREMIGLPDGPQLQQNAPNPFNSQTVISWFQLRPGPARVEVFALTGQRVAVLQEGPQKAGDHRVHWNGRDHRGRSLASGVYLFRLVTAQSVQTRKLTLLR